MRDEWHILVPADSPRFAVAVEGPDFRNEEREYPQEAGVVRGTRRECVSAMPVSLYPYLEMVGSDA